MKKLLVIFALVLFAVAAMAQERTITRTLTKGVYYDKYTGVAADTLKATNQDTIDIVYYYQSPEYVKKIAVKIRYDIIVGADTTVAASLFGKEFSDDATYVSIIGSSTSSAVTTNNTIQVLTLDPYLTEAQYVTGRVTGGDTINVAHSITPFDFTYRYFRLRLIIQGNDAVGTGIKVDEVEGTLVRAEGEAYPRFSKDNAKYIESVMRVHDRVGTMAELDDETSDAVYTDNIPKLHLLVGKKVWWEFRPYIRTSAGAAAGVDDYKLAIVAAEEKVDAGAEVEED